LVLRVKMTYPGPSKTSKPNKSICRFFTFGGNNLSVVGNGLIDATGLGGFVVGATLGDFVVSSLVGFDDKIGLDEADALGENVEGREIVGSSVGVAAAGC